ncbi:phage tail assembly protein [Escherichia coli]|nr:phage tail assembly protein [Escherichia coli]MCN8239266.1 phage tail assembly protein [Escherichia coli]
MEKLTHEQFNNTLPSLATDCASCTGYPYQMNQDESVRLLAHVVSKYIVRLAKVPQSSVDQMSPADLNAAAWLVAGFFLQA